MNTFLPSLLNHALYLAQVTQPAKVDPPWWANSNTMLFVVVGAAMIFMMTTSGKAKKAQEKQRVEMLSNLKRGDRVETIGGILGSVVEARENEVVIKIDESTNTKIRMLRSAIKRVVTDEVVAATK